MEQWLVVSVLILSISWKALCVWLRKRRSLYLASLDPVRQAYELNCYAYFVEFPFLTDKALEFALFKTYAIPSISTLLAQTGQLVNRNTYFKRADDTDILLRELVLSGNMESQRAKQALARLNFIHGCYNISNEDYLYTLSLLIVEPPKWASRFGYREWTEGEKLASFTVWHDIGVGMGIQNIPERLEDLVKFKEEYERSKVAFGESNRVLADAAVDLLLAKLPTFLHSIGRYTIYSLLDDKLRDSFQYPNPSKSFRVVVEFLMRLVLRHFVSWFMPTRPACWSVSRISQNHMKNGDELVPLAYHKYATVTYPDGYRLCDLGPFKPGKLAQLPCFHHMLICPAHDKTL